MRNTLDGTNSIPESPSIDWHHKIRKCENSNSSRKGGPSQNAI